MCPPLSQATSCTPTKSNLFLANSLAAAVNEPDLYRLLTFQVPNFIYYPHILRIILKKIRAKNMVHIAISLTLSSLTQYRSQSQRSSRIVHRWRNSPDYSDSYSPAIFTMNIRMPVSWRAPARGEFGPFNAREH